MATREDEAMGSRHADPTRMARAVLRLVEMQNRHVAGRIDEAMRAHADAATGASPGRILAETLRAVDGAVEREWLDWLAKNEPELARAVEAEIFRFDELAELDDRSVQEVLREIEAPELAMALKAASNELQAKVFQNMSTRAVVLLKKDMEVMGAVREGDCAKAQQRIEEVMRTLEARGKISLPRHRGERLVP